MSKDKKEKIVSQNDEAQKRIAELEQEVQEAKSNNSNASMVERIAYLEGKLKDEKSEEQLYIERKQKYLDNVAKKQAKEKAKAKAIAAIDSED